jgi:putative MATE family efflux protein
MDSKNPECSVEPTAELGVVINSNESISRTFWRYATPSIAAMVVNGLYQVVDGIFIGYYVGFEGLAGINMAIPIIAVVIGFGIMVGMGAGSLMSIYRGEGHNGKAQCILVNSFWLIAIMAGCSMLFIYYLGSSLLVLQGAESNLLFHSLDYINVFIWGAGVAIAAGVIPMLIRNDDSPNFATGLMILGAAINIVLDYVLIGLLGWGLEGAAIGTVIAELVVAIIGIGYFLSSRATIKLDLTQLKINFVMMRGILTLGVSSLFMFLYFSFVIAIHNKLLMSYGSAVQVGAFAIIGYIATLYYMIAEGIANGMQPPVSYYYGAQQVDRIKATVLLALKIVIVSGIATVVVLNLYPELIVNLFSNNDPALARETENGLRLHLCALFLDGFLFIASVYFMAVNQGRKALAVSVGNIIIPLPFLYFLPQWFGVDGIWLSLPLSNVLLTLIVAPVLWRDIQNRVR